MRSRLRFLMVLFILLSAVIACASPLPGSSTASPVNVDTSVAQTFQAMTAVPPATTVTPPPPTPTSSLLPRSLYFLNNGPDNGGAVQVFRLAADGVNLTRLTFEPASVTDFDISQVNAQIVYVSNNQLLLVNADGSGRRVLVDGGPLVSDAYAPTNLGAPRWSPDGATIAFSRGGLDFYNVATGVIETALVDKVDTSAGFLVLNEGYSPKAYSPDGTKLLLNISYYEGGTQAVYVPAAKTLNKLTSPDGVVCCISSWSPDSSAIFTTSSTIGMIASGMWRFDAASGNGVTLLANPADGNGPFVFADTAQVGPDGQLYYFYSTYPTAPEGHTPLKMVRSALDGVTNRVELRPDVFQNINEILWSPDMSFAVVAFAPVQDVYAGGEAEIVYADGRPNVSLTPFAMDMKWGP